MFKQTLLYFSPIFFAFMLGEALERRSKLGILVRLTKLALVVIGTIAAHIFPFIARCADVDCVKHQLWNILIRIFPFDRGVFEDYVANFWIVISPVIKLRAASRENLRLIGISSTWLTLLGCLPVCWFLATNPRKHLFPLGLAACSLSFYLFSWMVHEKAILLPLTAVLISIPTLVRTKNSDLVLRVTEASVLSLWRLMTYDKCAIGGLAVSVFGYHCLRNTVLSREISAGIESAHRVDHRFMSVLSIFANTIALTGFALDVAVKPPTGLPYLWPLVISAGCFGTFFLSWFRIIHLVWYDSM
jgi:alpha-1,3-glucosyltransferase